MLHDPCLSLPLDLTWWPLTSETGNDTVSVLRKVQRALALRDSWALTQKVLTFSLSLSKIISLPCHFSGSTAKAKIRSAKRIVMDKRVKVFFACFFKTAAVLFSLSHFQSADFYYLATLARVLWLIWQVFVSCVAVVEICSRSYILPLRCSNKQWSRLWLQSLLG